MFDLYQKPAVSRGIRAWAWVYFCGTVLYAADLFRHSSGMHSAHGRAWFVVKCAGLTLWLVSLVSRKLFEQHETVTSPLLPLKPGS